MANRPPEREPADVPDVHEILRGFERRLVRKVGAMLVIADVLMFFALRGSV